MRLPARNRPLRAAAIRPAAASDAGSPRRSSNTIYCEFSLIFQRFNPILDGVDLITPREAAHRLGVSYPTVKQWIYKGSMRTRRTAGGHHRDPDTEIERLLAATGRPLPRPPAPHIGRDRRAERPQPASRHRRGSAQRGVARAGPAADRRSDPDRDHHPRRGGRAEAPARRRGAGGHQVDRGHGRAGRWRNPPQQHERPGLHLDGAAGAELPPEPLFGHLVRRSRRYRAPASSARPRPRAAAGTRAPRGAR